MESEAILYCDGASRGNPGPASIGAVLYGKGKEKLAEISERIGRATNNVAEYRALIAGLRAAKGQGCQRVRVRMDSQLAVFQVLGRYKVKNAGLKPLHTEVRSLLTSFPSWAIEHIPREQNTEADALANAALDA